MLTQDFVIVGNDVITGSVDVGSAAITITHMLVGTNVLSSAVDVGKARFRFEEINVPDKIFTQINIPVETWTETTDTPSEIWTDAA